MQPIDIIGPLVGLVALVLKVTWPWWLVALVIWGIVREARKS